MIRSRRRRNEFESAIPRISKGRDLKLVIFDVDGTLIDSQEFILEAQRRAFASLGLARPSRETSLSIVGLSLTEAFTRLAGATAPVEQLARAYRDAWTALRADPAFSDPLFPGAREAVEGLARRDDLMLGIATGKSRRGVMHLFDRFGWHAYFATVQTADEHPSKPAPDMILTALAETGIDPNLAFMIGDTSYDMEMARSAGVRAIGVDWGYHPQAQLREAGAERIVTDFAALLELIES
jgi:phosphoglycolate phosphatase